MAWRRRRRGLLRRRVGRNATAVAGLRSIGRRRRLWWRLGLLRCWLGLLRWWLRLLLWRRRLVRYGLHTLWWRRRLSRRGRHLLWCRRRLRRNHRWVRRRDFSGGNRSDDQGEHCAMRVTRARRFPPRRRVDHGYRRRRRPQLNCVADRVAGVCGDAACRLIRCCRGLRRDGRYLALIVRAVGLHCRADESIYGFRNATGRIEARERVLVIPIISNQFHQVADRHAVVEFAANFVGCLDEARHVVDWRDAFVTKQCQKLVILARVGRYRTAGQNCAAGKHRNGGNYGA